MNKYVERALNAGQEAGPESIDWTWEKTVGVAYDNACNLFDGDDSAEFTDNEFDLITGAYIGGYLGARYRAMMVVEKK